MKSRSSRWAADYERDGYLVFPDVLDAGTLANLRRGIEDITADPDAIQTRLKRHLDFEHGIIMELPVFDQVFADLICYEPLLDLLEPRFASTEFSFHNYKCIIKAPRGSSRFRWHRDLPYLQHSSPRLITAMLCIDDMTEANGATVVLPGTHRIPHDKVPKTDTDIPEDELPEGERVTVECPAGSAVLFHINLIHGGEANRSETPRRNVIGIWAGPDTYPTTSARYAYQGLMPRSRNPARRQQVRKTFPHLFERTEEPLVAAATQAD